jgi:hypothetical protein
MRTSVAAALLAFAFAARGAEQTVEQTRKNIRVLQGLPESQLFMAMNSLAQSLGVHCDYCHVKSGDKWVWHSDEKPAKQVAREMITMTRSIKPAVTCHTCHRGSTGVVNAPPLPPYDHDPTAAPPHAAPVLPSSAEIVKRYLAALGGTNLPAKKTVVELTLERSQGRKAQAVMTIEPPDSVDVVGTTEKGPLHQATSGNDDLSIQLRRTAALYDVVRVTEPAAEMKVLGIERVGDRDAYAVAVRDKKYFFDVQTGLLLREWTVTETLLALLPRQVDFGDYRDAGGVKRPFFIRTSDAAPYDTTTYIARSIRRE